MAVNVYDPIISITFTKTGARKEIAENLPVDPRIEQAGLTISLDKLLGDGCSVSVSKSVKQLAGTFSITLSDSASNDHLESAYGYIEPMDLVEIRMTHGHSGKTCSQVPIAMRGFVTEVSRNESVDGGGIPNRTVTITGHDYGKLLQIFRLYYKDNMIIGNDTVHSWGVSMKYLEGMADNTPASTFIAENVVKAVQSWLAITTWNNEKKQRPFAKISAHATSEGLVQIKMLNEAQDGTSWLELISSSCDVSSGFNEFFTVDREEDVMFVLRPTPAFHPDGKLVHPSDKNKDYFPEDVEINSSDIVSINVSRTDSNTANLFRVNIPSMLLETDSMWQVSAKDAIYEGDTYPNCDAKRFGVKEMRQTVSLYAPDDNVENWFTLHKERLAAIGKNAVVFESGTIRLKGNEKIKAGGILKINRGTTEWQCYVEQVSHEFQPYNGYFTTVHFTYGTGYINRTQIDRPYARELATDNKQSQESEYDSNVYIYNDSGEFVGIANEQNGETDGSRKKNPTISDFKMKK